MTREDPPFFHDSVKKYRRINGDTFCSLFDNHSQFDKMLVIDCRRAYEYEGGHIKGAIRVHPFEDEFESLYSRVYDPGTLFIFHCEYSMYRAPASIMRFYDQHENAGRAREDLHAFVLDGGYLHFWPEHPDYCDGGYTPEEDTNETPQSSSS
jgi:rhodanese-related sulfurtransferase